MERDAQSRDPVLGSGVVATGFCRPLSTQTLIRNSENTSPEHSTGYQLPSKTQAVSQTRLFDFVGIADSPTALVKNLSVIEGQ